MKSKTELKDIDVKKIEINPENPRIFFREGEMNDLAISIETKGLQVPISVYKDGTKYIIIDGERRWRTFKTLKKSQISAIVQSKPNELDNLLLMFNIHGLREQWDAFTIAMKIEKVLKLFIKDKGIVPTESELSREVGMSRGIIRRSKMIIALPARFKRLLRTELEKPKNKQRFSEDFFIEMENSLRAVTNNIPETINNIDNVRDILIEKYLDGNIKSVTDFRKLTKIATASKNTTYPIASTKQNLKLIFSKNNIGIDEVYKNSVEPLYGDKKLINTADNLYIKLSGISKSYVKNDAKLREILMSIKAQIESLL